MASTPLPPATRRLVGLLCTLSGALLAVGLLLRVVVSAYAWQTAGAASPPALQLSFNLLGLLASGLLVRLGRRLRRGDGPRRDPHANELL